MNEENLPSLNVKDYTSNTIKALIQGIPYAGSSLEQFIFGPLQEKRLRRMEKTLHEIAEKLGEIDSQKMVTEEFVALLENVAPEISRSIGNDKRERFRDLLFNASQNCDNQEQWEEANLASSLLHEIDAPGLSLLAAIGRTKKDHPVTLTSSPCPQIAVGEFDFDNPSEPQHIIPYQWPVVEYWARQLKEKQIINYRSHDARGGFGEVTLGYMGEFLIKWVLLE